MLDLTLRDVWQGLEKGLNLPGWSASGLVVGHFETKAARWVSGFKKNNARRQRNMAETTLQQARKTTAKQILPAMLIRNRKILAAPRRPRVVAPFVLPPTWPLHCLCFAGAEYCQSGTRL